MPTWSGERHTRNEHCFLREWYHSATNTPRFKVARDSVGDIDERCISPETVYNSVLRVSWLTSGRNTPRQSKWIDFNFIIRPQKNIGMRSRVIPRFTIRVHGGESVYLCSCRFVGQSFIRTVCRRGAAWCGGLLGPSMLSQPLRCIRIRVVISIIITFPKPLSICGIK